MPPPPGAGPSNQLPAYGRRARAASLESLRAETARAIPGLSTRHLNAKLLTPTPDRHIVPAHRPRNPDDGRFATLTPTAKIRKANP
jgi:hypothetical protein